MAALDRSQMPFLSLSPVHFSLTTGTNIPAPQDTPPASPERLIATPPTPGGGPLQSHPVTAMDMPGAFPPTPEPEKQTEDKTKPSTSTSNTPPDRKDSFRTPESPASATQQQSSPQPARRPSSVRKLFSLNNLRNSFSSSRPSLASNAQARPSTTSDAHPQHGLKRPSSPTTSTSTTASTAQARAPLRPKKSRSWLRRKSGMFLPNTAGTAPLSAVQEVLRPETRDSKRSKMSDVREFSPAPLLPDIGTLRGGRMTGGQLGWDESCFAR